jgi:hypothetical protein
MLVDNLIPGVGELMLASFPSHPKFNMGISTENAWYGFLFIFIKSVPNFYKFIFY